MSQNIALAKLKQLNESQKAVEEAKAPTTKKISRKPRKVNEDLEVTDEVYVVADAETGEILSDIIADKDEAIDVAQEIAQEQGVEVVAEALIRKAKVVESRRKVTKRPARPARNESLSKTTRKAAAKRRVALKLK